MAQHVQKLPSPLLTEAGRGLDSSVMVWKVKQAHSPVMTTKRAQRSSRGQVLIAIAHQLKSNHTDEGFRNPTLPFIGHC